MNKSVLQETCKSSLKLVENVAMEGNLAVWGWE